MRKIFLIVLMAVATVASAQCYTKFKGIEIKGNVDTFGAQLEKQGYKLEEKAPGLYLYSGKFSGEQVALWVHCTVKTRTVYAVQVLFDDKDTRELIQNRYNSLKDLLSQKYGEPAEKDVPYGNDGEYEYSGDICTRWKDNCGGVTLKNTHIVVSKYQSMKVVMIMYWSEEGYELNKTELSEDL